MIQVTLNTPTVITVTGYDIVGHATDEGAKTVVIEYVPLVSVNGAPAAPDYSQQKTGQMAEGTWDSLAQATDEAKAAAVLLQTLGLTLSQVTVAVVAS
jgi:hypothetical protein